MNNVNEEARLLLAAGHQTTLNDWSAGLELAVVLMACQCLPEPLPLTQEQAQNDLHIPQTEQRGSLNAHANIAPQSELPDWFVDFMSRYADPKQPSIAEVHADMRKNMGRDAPEYWMICKQLRDFERSMFEGAL